MIQLEFGGQRWPLVAGESVIGSAPDAAVRVERAGVQPRHALVDATATSAALRRADPGAVLSVNGVRLGTDPVPLLHGDKIQLGPVDLVVVDDRRAGTTTMSDASALRAATASVGAAASPRGASGGRLVSQSDGREYQIGEAPLVFGRDAACDVVIESTDVSRRHAVIVNGPGGYVLEDISANGILVNGTPAGERRLLIRGDVVKIGPAEFRFYADAARLDSPPPGAAHRLFDTVHGIPAMVPAFPSRPTAPPPLATVLIRSGGMRGQRLPIRTPVVNIGRADYNDLVFGEESVSASHAKLQRREELWVLTDLGSTNGTFVDGEQVHGEVALMPGSTVRFGDLTLLFDPTDTRGPQPMGGGTRVAEAIAIPETPRMPSIRPEPVGPRRPEGLRGRRAPSTGLSPRVVAVIVLLAGIAAVAAYFFFGR